MAEKENPYLVVNPHTFLKFGKTWMAELEKKKMDDIEIRVDFELPEGRIRLVEPHLENRTREADLPDDGSLNTAFIEV